MAYIAFGPPDPRTPVQEDRPFGFSVEGTADEVVTQLNAGGGGFAVLQKVSAATGETQRVHVWTPSVLWVEDE